ncbi:MAG: hypothetical protein WBD46_12815, partial [Acidobacteriaceae bacterium]
MVFAAQVETAAGRRNPWADFRLIPRIETWPAVVSFAQTAPGKIVLLALFGLGMRFFIPSLAEAAGTAF